MTEYTRPEDIEITDELVADSFKKKKLREGVMKLRVTKAKDVVAKTGSYMEILTLNPVDLDDDVRSPPIRVNFVYPFRNEEYTDDEGNEHAAPDTQWVCEKYLKATQSDVPAYAKRNSEDKSYETVEGEVLTEPEGKTYNKGVRKQYLGLIRDRFRDGDLFIHDELYGRVTWNKRGWPEITDFFSEPPVGEEIITENFGIKE